MITVVTGPPAAGKSTYVNDNAPAGALRVDFDAIAQALTTGEPDPHDHPEPIRRATHVARDAVIEHALDDPGVDVWIIHSSPTQEQLEKYEEAGAEFVTIDPGIEAVLEQAQQDCRPDWTEAAIRDWYEKNGAESKTRNAAQNTTKGGADMAVIHKTFAAKVTPSVKDSGDPEGTFEAIVSVFGNKDHGGDIVEAGAFTKTIHEWALKEVPIPLVWAHQYGDVDNFIGEIKTIEETEQGLKIKAQLDLDHPKAARVHQLMKRGLINEFSWSGLVREYEWIEDDDEDSWWPGMKMLDIDLWEAGPCFKGANPDTDLLSIKTDGRIDGPLLRAKAGRVLSQQNIDSLKEARDAISKVLDAAEPADDQEQESEPAGADTTEAGKSATETTAPLDAAKHSQALLELIATTTN